VPIENPGSLKFRDLAGPIYRVFQIAVKQVLNYEHESQLRWPHRYYLKGREGSSTRMIEIPSVTFCRQSAYNYLY
jgi:hypothetical protein